ncbi:MAG TPA: non-canonical purine NTP pyrophosphatase [Gemmatimonadaceae bacterium]|nr:non-canonical purine NTP pyrophosphatase [Gemmatimonadaceae bacterium]
MSGGPYLLATRSEGKLRELREIFADFQVAVIDLRATNIDRRAEEDDLERYLTFEENALAKVRYFYERAGGIPTFADDSGICVDALGGEPGVYSKRWSGREGLNEAAVDAANNEKLMRSMREARQRQGSHFTDAARYVAVAAYKDANIEVVRRGEIVGRVLEEPRGTGGFGYDPFFEAPELGGTFAESQLRKTASVSHRARAFRELLTALRVEGRI